MTSAETSLQRQLFGYKLLIYILIGVLGYFWGWGWMLGSLLVSGGHLWFVWWKLGENRPNLHTPPYPTLGAANTLTLTRGILNSLLAGFIFAPIPPALRWLPMILWTASSFADLFDGIVARLTKRQTRLGELLDLEFDASAMLIVILFTIVHDLMPAWTLILALARYLFVIGLKVRQSHHLPIAPMTDSVQRRIEAGIQMSFLTVVLWPTVGKPFTTVAAYAFGLPFAALFLRDWLVVSTWLDPQNCHYRQLRRHIHTLIYTLLPLCGRLYLAYLLLTRTIPIDLTTWLGWAALVTSAMLLLGLASRLGAILSLIPLVFGGGLLVPRLIMLVFTIAIIQFGGGKFCLWLPEEIIFKQRLG